MTTNSGFLGWYVRNKRSNSETIVKRPYKRKLQTPPFSSVDHGEILKTVTSMKNKVINLNADNEAIVQAMASTYEYRRDWILSSSPSITEILDAFPKFGEMPYLVIKINT